MAKSRLDWSLGWMRYSHETNRQGQVGHGLLDSMESFFTRWPLSEEFRTVECKNQSSRGLFFCNCVRGQASDFRCVSIACEKGGLVVPETPLRSPRRHVSVANKRRSIKETCGGSISGGAAHEGFGDAGARPGNRRTIRRARPPPRNHYRRAPHPG